MKKRILGILLAAAICFSLIGSSIASAAPASTEEPIELTICVGRRPYDSTASYAEKHWVQKAEKACNVKITWIELLEDSMSEQLAAVLAGNLPDAFMCGKHMADPLIVQSTDMWRSFTLDEIREWAPTYYATCERYIDDWQNFVTYPDGKIYGLMGSVYDSERHYASGVMFMNQKWVEELGMKMPTTLDELHDILIAFRDNDMNGNGDTSDEYPINFCNSFYASQVIEFASWWGLPINNSTFYQIKDGNVVSAVDTQAFREFLEYFYQLGQEGLLNLEGFSTTSDQYTAECDAMKSGIFGAWAPSYFITNTNNAQQYVGIPAIHADGYEESYFHTPFNHANRNAFVVSRTCANPEAALRFYDYLSDPAFAVEVFMGEEGLAWTFVDDEYHFVMNYCPNKEADPDGYAAFVQKMLDCGYNSYVEKGIMLDGSNLNNYNTTGLVDYGSLVLHSQGYDMTNRADGNVVRVQAIRDITARGGYSEPMNLDIVPADKQEEYDFMCDGLDTLINAFVADSIKHGVTDESWNAYLSQLKAYNYDYYIEFYNAKYHHEL